MVYNAQNYWVSEHCPSSRILNARKHNVVESGCFRPQVRAEDNNLLSLLERTTLNHWTTFRKVDLGCSVIQVSSF
jgi:hypothetical protein